RDLGGDGVGVETNRCRDLREDLGLRDLAALVVAGRERSNVPVVEGVGEVVTHGDAPQQRVDSASPVLGVALPHRRFDFLDVHLGGIDSYRTKRRNARPSASPTAAPAATSETWCSRT